MFYYRHYDMSSHSNAFITWAHIKFIHQFFLYLTEKIIQLLKAASLPMQKKETLKQQTKPILINLLKKPKGVQKHERDKPK